MPTYSDIDRNLAPDDSGDVRITTDETTLDHAIRNLLLTSRGERYMKPNVGANLREALGEPMDDETRRFLKTTIQRGLRQEPRIELDRMSIDFVPEEHSAIISIVWSSPVSFSKKKTSINVSIGG